MANPYRNEHGWANDLLAEPNARDRVHEIAPGLNAGLLDVMLRQAFADGYQRGESDTHREYSSKQAVAWDEGREEGFVEGVAEIKHKMSVEINHRLDIIATLLDELPRPTKRITHLIDYATETKEKFRKLVS